MNKDKYGEVFTPSFFVQQMIDDCKYIMGNDFFDSIESIFEPGAGLGIFFDVLQNQNTLFNKDKFHYYFNEINTNYHEDLIEISKQYSSNVSFFIKDLFTIDISLLPKVQLVIGNLPFNIMYKKFVPGLHKKNIETKSEIIKNSSQSITIWNKMTLYSFQHIIQDNGYYFCIIPCIWLKKDRAKIYDLFIQQYTIHFLKVFNCTSANKIFKYHCQTPICYVLVQKKLKIENTPFYCYNHYIEKYQPFLLHQNYCIPTKMSSYFSLYYNYCKDNPHKTCFDMIKKISSLDPNCINHKLIEFKKGGLETYTLEQQNTFKIITGANFNKKTNYLSLNGFVSKNQGLYYGKPKLILPHKRQAKFFKDYNGEYSCIGRDMYVFLCDDSTQIDDLYDFFNLEFMNHLIENGFTIRMNFIEKYIFQYIPWIFDTNFSFQKWQMCCIY